MPVGVNRIGFPFGIEEAFGLVATLAEDLDKGGTPLDKGE
jgi:hypothetical protein